MPGEEKVVMKAWYITLLIAPGLLATSPVYADARKPTSLRSSASPRNPAWFSLDRSLHSFLNGQRNWNERIMDFAARIPQARLQDDSLHLPRQSLARLPANQLTAMTTYHSRALRKYEEMIRRYPSNEQSRARQMFPFAPIRVVLDP